MSDWQPMETAPSRPLDENGFGPTILVWVEDAVGIAFWDDDFGRFYIETHEHHPQPSHWMPLPAPPLSSKERS